jgi:uncharacterized membrane protein
VTLLAITVLGFCVGFVQKLPCHNAGWPWRRELIFGRKCYSDIPILYRGRGLVDGIFPYSPDTPEHPLEYPVLTGYVMDWTARLLTAPDSRAYYLVNVIVLVAFACATVLATAVILRDSGGRPGDAILVAAAPTLVLAGTINWDLVPVLAVVLAILAWTRDRPLLTGVLIGLGTAAKLFPAFLLGPLLILCIRQRKLREFGLSIGGAVVAWAAVNAPVLLLYPDGWLEFWRFNADRKADFGSVWYAIELLGTPVPAVNSLALGSFVLLCAAIAALLYWKPASVNPASVKPASFAQGAFLVVAAFLLTNKVYSPQYVLWLLPLAVLARAEVPLHRVLRDFAIWQVAEVVYWAMVWEYLAWTLTNPYAYPAATFARIAVTLYLCGQVVREIVAPPPSKAPPQIALSLRQVEPSTENAV